MNIFVMMIEEYDDDVLQGIFKYFLEKKITI